MKELRVFEYKPGRRRKGWICSPCAEPFYRAGQYSAPFYVPIADLLNERCVICRRRLDFMADPLSERPRGLAGLSGSDVMAVCGPGSVR